MLKIAKKKAAVIKVFGMFGLGQLCLVGQENTNQ
jgi:hypothetical protein